MLCPKKGMRLYIISNRLPVKVTGLNGTFVFSRSEGGLATGLDSLQTSYEKHWIGWPGMCVKREEDKKEILARLEELNFHPVFLSESQIENYYEGYSNSTIWPLCHYFFAYTLYKKCFWDAYKQVNRLFCEEICRLVRPGDRVWIQDYQLMLLPNMLREACPGVCIGYFHHIPFPSYELFRVLPERAELLKGLLGADFIAFHTHDYMRHFISTVERVLRIDFNLDEARIGDRVVRVDALPMGINYDLYHEAFDKPEVRKAIERNRQFFGKHKLMISVDRLDYSKGILHRLWGFASFLSHHPEYHGKVTLAMVIVPSRDHVGSYAELKTKIDEEIGAINGRYSTMDWTPVCYFYHSFSFEELTAMYYMADIALVTPLRDGMNLVAKEYVAVKRENPGVLILSEMAGASAEMADALRINPNDTGEIEAAICEALEMPEEEQMARLERMRKIVSTQTVNKWAADFVDGLNDTFTKNTWLCEKRLSKEAVGTIRHSYLNARRRLILLDYDGTLAAIENRPEDARPTEEILALLRKLSEDPANHVVINSGRDQSTLEEWLGALPISLAAEHGASYKEGGVWHQNLSKIHWAPELLSILRLFIDKTPRAHLEIKDAALAWHYRESDAWLGALRARQLIHALMPVCMRRGLQILSGDKVVEVKSLECNKGSEVNRLLARRHYDFILAMGDDTTDEDMFQALPKDAVTIKIGNVSEIANYHMSSQEQVLPFLRSLLGNEETEADKYGGKYARLTEAFLNGWRSLARNRLLKVFSNN
ncbi:bifunctional alpha,alpha-trehalose-phosphate synthase (UDP-forming)/trehalose-phosphatase [uncultured Parabacteroides sp.]|uniref:bifunctional alpha,alpha-trehalose-phosphate synthase (UDP-forming)/trehalose-phosphatase n=1 Tax=uncultured Parabacteroides sp. TaxID=512312 RepID=UPI0026139231|nr:bifunctional alpha,alpha-trehalose-phosphate synthase (UDP-forming)/trehalose-phosphatase [uncultured Parabacteroides sp.]